MFQNYLPRRGAVVLTATKTRAGLMTSKTLHAVMFTVEEQRKQIENLTERLESKERELYFLKSSLAWRLTLPYRLGGTVLKKAFILLKLLLRDPKAFLLIFVRLIAKFVRSREIFRKYGHKILSIFPQSLTRRLSSLAPPSAEEAGNPSADVSHLQTEFVGEAGWIYRRLIKPTSVVKSQEVGMGS